MSTIQLENRQAWLDARKGGLGASDVPVALGLVASKSPFMLWAEKCDLLPEQDLAETIEAVDWGIRLQDAICAGFADRTGREVLPGDPFTIIRDDKYPFLFSSLDAIQNCNRRGRGVLEAKNVGTYMAAEWADGGVPLKFQVQVQAQLRCSQLEWGSIAALVGGNKLVYRDLERDENFLDAAIPHLERFWQHVEDRVAPEVDSSLITQQILQRLHPDDSGEEIELPTEAAEWEAEFRACKEKIEVLEELAQLNKNRLISAIGEATFAVLPDGSRYSYKTQQRGEYVAKASKFRVLRKLKG